MSKLVRPIEGLRQEVIQMQKEAARKAGKRFLTAAGSVPPNKPNGPSNLNNIAKIKKYIEKYSSDFSNKITDFKINLKNINYASFLR